jgi:phage-related baseplate assembly protein
MQAGLVHHKANPEQGKTTGAQTENITGRQRIQSFIEKYSNGGPDEA